MVDETIYADDVNYFKTGKSSSDSWLDKAESEIESLGGTIIARVSGMMNGKSAIMVGFELEGQSYKITYPVLQPRKSNDKSAAMRQAATALYHEVKALCVSAKFRGARAAFFAYTVLPDGRTAEMLTATELSERAPELFLLPVGNK